MYSTLTRSILLLSLLFSSIAIQAQIAGEKVERIEISKAEDTSRTDSIPWAKHKINFTPFSLFSTFHPGIELGYERLHGKRFSTEYHIMLVTSRDNEYARDSQGMMAGFELKYFHTNNQQSRWYYALALEGMEKTHEAELFYTLPTDDEYEIKERDDYFSRMVDVKKTFFTMTLRAGLQHYLTPHIIIEGYTGIGIRYRDVNHPNAPTIAAFHSDRDYLSLDLEYSSNREVSDRVLKFDLNIRFAWTF